MTPAASPVKAHSPPGPVQVRVSRFQRFFAAWQLLPVALVALIAFLTLTPEGVAEPMQDVACWLLVGSVATFAVLAIVKGLDRLLDCDGE